MLAYSSLSHVNYCLLALFAVTGFAGKGGERALAAGTAALDGAMLQMFNHGLSAAALFFLVGVLEARAGGQRGLGDFGGVRAAAPVLAGLCGVAVFSSLGLPGLNGFVSEFLIFRGVFGLAPGMAAAACLGLLATAVYLLTFYQRVFHGPPTPATAEFRDLSGRETTTVALAVILMFVLGIFPHPLINLVNGLASLWAFRLGPPLLPLS
jgi:NADH-quinone oxidoreductase subunit M